MLPTIRAVITADTKDAEAGFDRVSRSMRETESAADSASRSVNRMGGAVNRAGGRVSGAFTRNVQNAAFQLGDFAAQVGAGTSASIALGQQLPQLLGGFGVLGAVLGAVAAIAVPLTRAFVQMSESGQDLGRVLGVLSPLASTIADGFREVARVGVVMAEAIINNLDRILITAGLVAGFFVGRWVVAFAAARIATFSLVGALTALRTMLIRLGIGAIVVGLGEAVYQFTRLSQATGDFGEALRVVGNVFREVFDRMRTSVSLLGEIFQGLGMVIQGAFLSAFGVAESAFTSLMNSIIRGLNVIRETAGAEPIAEFEGGGAGQRGGRLMEGGAAVIGSAAGQMARDLSAPLESVEQMRELLRSIKDERITIPDLLGVATDDDDAGGGKSIQDKLSEQQKAVAEHIAQIKALTQGGLNDQLGAWGNYFGSLIQLTGTSNRRMLGIQRSFAAAASLVNAYQAYTEVLKDPNLPWWGRIAAAGKVLAAGIGAVNAIRSVGESGGGAAGTVGGVASATGQALAAPPVQRSLTLVGDTFNRQQAIRIAEFLNDGTDDGLVIRGRR